MRLQKELEYGSGRLGKSEQERKLAKGSSDEEANNIGYSWYVRLAGRIYSRDRQWSRQVRIAVGVIME